MRKMFTRRRLAFVAVALIGAALVIPYYRQLIFGPTYQGVPLCAWQDRIRRQTLGETDKTWFAKLRQWIQSKHEPSASTNLRVDEKIAIWLTLLDDPAPAMRVRAIQVLWGTSRWGLRGGAYLSYLSSVDVMTFTADIKSIDYRLVASSRIWSDLVVLQDWSGWEYPRESFPPPPVAPHLVRLLDDPAPEVRQAAFNALGGQGAAAAPAFPRLWELLDDTDSTRRNQAMQALNLTHPKTRDWLNRLLAMLEDPVVDVRRSGADCLASWHDRRIAKAAGPALLKLARDRDALCRVQAAATLSSLGMHLDEATAVLRAALRHPDAAMRSRAIGALFDSAGAALYADLVQCARFDADRNVRIGAISSLRYGGKQAVPLLVAFLRDPDGDFRGAAMGALRGLGPQAKEAVPFVLAELEHLGANGVQVLSDIGDPEAVPRLIELLDHGELCQNALTALQNLGADARSALPRLLELFAEHGKLNQQIFYAVMAIDGDNPKVFAALEKQVLEDFAAGRIDSLSAFCQLGVRAHAIVPALVQRLQSQTEADISNRAMHVQMLGNIGPAAHSAVPTLLRLAAEADSDLRSGIIITLGNIAALEQEVVPWLIEQLEREHGVRAANALAQFGPRARSAREPLRRLLPCRELEERVVAVAALAAIGPAQEMLELLSPLLRDPEANVRITALQILSLRGSPSDVLPLLLPLLQDEKDEVRSAAARAIGEMGPAALAATRSLAALLDDDSHSVAEEALWALSNLEP